MSLMRPSAGLNSGLCVCWPGVNDADLDQLDGPQLPPIDGGPGFILNAEAEAASAQVATLRQGEHIVPELGVRHVEAERQPLAILGQPERAGAGTGQQPTGIVVDQRQHVPAGCLEGDAERPSPDGLDECPDGRRAVEHRSVPLQASAGCAHLSSGAQFQPIRKVGRDHDEAGAT